MAFDTFMYFEGSATLKSGSLTIKGETTDTAMSAKSALELYSFSFGASNPVTIGSHSSGAGAGKVSLSAFSIMKKTDAASPELFAACAQGAHFPKATVELRKAGGGQNTYLQYVFTEVYVESIQWSGSSGGDDAPSESVSFAYGGMTINYTPQKTDGTAGVAVSQSWSQITNTPVAG